MKIALNRHDLVTGQIYPAFVERPPIFVKKFENTNMGWNADGLAIGASPDEVKWLTHKPYDMWVPVTEYVNEFPVILLGGQPNL